MNDGGRAHRQGMQGTHHLAVMKPVGTDNFTCLTRGGVGRGTDASRPGLHCEGRSSVQTCRPPSLSLPPHCLLPLLPASLQGTELPRAPGHAACAVSGWGLMHGREQRYSLGQAAAQLRHVTL